MTIKQSQLELKDFVILNFNYNFISPTAQRKGEQPQKSFEEYFIDANFAIQPTSENTYNIFVKFEINKNEKQLPGYAIFIEGVGVFSIPQDIGEEEKGALLTNSAVVMTINYIRTFVGSTTGHFPFGKYWIPSIDMNDLLEQKKKIAAQKERRKK